MPFAASMAFLLTSFFRPLMGIDSTGCYSSRPAADSESGQPRRLTGCSGGYGDLLELVALAYVTGRAQGVHDERARRQA